MPTNITVDEMMAMLSPNLQNDVIRDLCAGFLDMRRATHKPLTKHAWKLVANKSMMPTNWTDLEFACSMMNSTEADWQGVFQPNESSLQEYGPIYVSWAEELMSGKAVLNGDAERIKDKVQNITVDEMMAMLSPNLQNDVIRDLCAGFLDMRRAIHKPLTRMAWKIISSKALIPQPWTDLEFACVLMKSTETGWPCVSAPSEKVLQEYGNIYLSRVEYLINAGRVEGC